MLKEWQTEACKMVKVWSKWDQFKNVESGERATAKQTVETQKKKQSCSLNERKSICHIKKMQWNTKKKYRRIGFLDTC